MGFNKARGGGNRLTEELLCPCGGRRTEWNKRMKSSHARSSAKAHFRRAFTRGSSQSPTLLHFFTPQVSMMLPGHRIDRTKQVLPVHPSPARKKARTSSRSYSLRIKQTRPTHFDLYFFLPCTGKSYGDVHGGRIFLRPAKDHRSTRRRICAPWSSEPLSPPRSPGSASSPAAPPA